MMAVKAKNTFILILALAVFFGGFLNFALAAENQKTGQQDYIIKLNNDQGLPVLKSFGLNITPRFSFSNALEFRDVYTFKSALPLEILQERLAGNFHYLETANKMAAQAAVTNDPGFTSNPLDIDKQWGLVKVGFTDVWGKTTGSENTIVAVIDTGIDSTHDDLGNISFITGFNVLTRQLISPGTNSDDNGHGTLIAGLLGATPNNNIGIAGTNWDISIMPLKALDAEGKGEAAGVSEAIVWAADHNASVINLSLGGVGFGHDTTLANAIAYAFKKNAVIVAAAGNDIASVGGNLDLEPIFPICDDNNLNMVIGVTAVDHNDLKANFSNYGKNCIDVSAPGKRILSTINHDPLTKTAAPNAYAYASGTSMAVPYVSGQAALLKSLYPSATNTQIRDRIISTADPIDEMNLNQCGGQSCRGLIGYGRINVKKSLDADPLSITTLISEGDLVKLDEPSAFYRISGGQKRLISPFVYNQRFLESSVKKVIASDLSSFPEGPYETPLDGTLVKLDSNPTVYYITNGMKLPVTYQVFQQRSFGFGNINTVSYSEMNSWPSGNFLPPTEGTLIKSTKNKTVYWVVGSALHPINYNFYMERGLNIFPILTVSDNDISSFPKGEAYIR